MTDKEIIREIVDGIRNRKGQRIAVVDMSGLEEAPCQYFVIAEGNSNTQVNAISNEIEDNVRKQLKIKPFAVDGQDNAIWVAMDYSSIIVHIFQREAREFYDIEHLWADAKIEILEDE